MRQTGKTFRKLMESLKLASEGEHIIYVCENGKHADYIFHLSLDIVSMFMHSKYFSKERTVIIGDGSIRFVSDLMNKQDSYRGKKYKIIWDIL